MPDTIGAVVDILEISIPVEASLGPITLKIPAKPAQIAIVVRMATEELIKAGIITRSDFPAGSQPGPAAVAQFKAQEEAAAAVAAEKAVAAKAA